MWKEVSFGGGSDAIYPNGTSASPGPLVFRVEPLGQARAGAAATSRVPLRPQSEIKVSPPVT